MKIDIYNNNTDINIRVVAWELQTVGHNLYVCGSCGEPRKDRYLWVHYYIHR
jgi:hypothetical protein